MKNIHDEWEAAKAEAEGLKPVPYSVINPETGEVLRGGTIQFRDLALQAQPGEVVIEGALDGGKQMVSFTETGVVAVPRPSDLPTPEDIKREANRRIESEDVLPAWRVIREWSGGKPVSKERKAKAAAIRETSDRLEKSLPLDFRDDKHWSTK